VSDSISCDLLRICCTTRCTTSPQQVESQQQVYNRSTQQVVRQAASLITSWTTCRTASPQHVRSKLHATISKSYSKSHNLLYDLLLVLQPVVDFLLAFDLLWISRTAVRQICKKIAAVEHRVCHITSICCGCVVQHAVTTSCRTNPPRIEASGVGRDAVTSCLDVARRSRRRRRRQREQ